MAAATGLKAIDSKMLFFPAAFLVSLLPLYVAWAMPWTTADTIFLLYCCVALVPALFLQWTVGIVFSWWTRAPEDDPMLIDKVTF